MTSPGPTATMLARKVRAGDVLDDGTDRHAVASVEWIGRTPAGECTTVRLTLCPDLVLDAGPNDPLDVTRTWWRVGCT